VVLARQEVQTMQPPQGVPRLMGFCSTASASSFLEWCGLRNQDVGLAAQSGWRAKPGGPDAAGMSRDALAACGGVTPRDRPTRG
jgi:hypothetical protein